MWPELGLRNGQIAAKEQELERAHSALDGEREALVSHQRELALAVERAKELLEDQAIRQERACDPRSQG
jgi:hypothetical protein